MGHGASCFSAGTVTSRGSSLQRPMDTARVLRIEQFQEDPDKYIQLTPTLPADADHAAVIQAGRYSALWVRLRTAVPATAIEGWMAECENKKGGAVYLAMPQPLVSTDTMSLLLGRSYQFHHYHRETDELVWYRWMREGMKDLVPAYATSIEGGGSLILSPDEKKVLLVFELGRWGRVGGAVDPGETCLEAALRECHEETSIELDDSFKPLLGMGYQQPRSRDGSINDHFLLFIVRAKSMEIKLDKNELQAAEWFEIAPLVAAFAEAWKASGASDQRLPSVFEVNAKRVSTLELRSLQRFTEGSCCPVVQQFLNERRKTAAITF